MGGDLLEEILMPRGDRQQHGPSTSSKRQQRQEQEGVFSKTFLRTEEVSEHSL